MNLQLKHNFKAGWRNFLKYKTQNIISIICLSVGVMIFSVVTGLCIGIAYEVVSNDRYVEINRELVVGSDSCLPSWSSVVKSLKNLPSVETVIFENSMPVAKDYCVRDRDGKEIMVFDQFRQVSSDWMRMHNAFSEMSGKKYGSLKPGTLLMETSTRNDYIRKDVNVIGFEMPDLVPSNKIYDVCSFPAIGNLQIVPRGLYLVCDESEMDNIMMLKVGVILKEGYSQKQLCEHIKKLFPKSKMNPVVKDSSLENVVIVLLIIYGSCILIIGFCGFLKMQRQLFQLRKREMAVRRCNGAKYVHLFLLLCAEMLISFFFVFILTILIENVLLHYVYSYFSTQQFPVRLPYIHYDNYLIETVIIVITFIVSLIMSWISLRNVMKSPLGKYAGRSISTNSKTTKVFQVILFSFATILFYIVVEVLIWTIKSVNDYELANDLEFYKNIATVKSDEKLKIENVLRLPSVQNAGVIGKDNVTLSDSLPSDIVTTKNIFSNEENNYLITQLQPSVLQIVNAKIERRRSKVTIDDNEISTTLGTCKPKEIPVFALTAEAEQVSEELGIIYPLPAERFIIEDGKEYTLLGFTLLLDIHRNSFPISSFCEVVLNADSIKGYSKKMLVQPKDGRYSFLCEELNDLYHQLNSSVSPKFNLPINSLFVQYFKLYGLLSMIIQLCMFIAVICIINIVLSVYSSVSLETRCRQKEVAIRKIYGAKIKDIVILFCRYYILTLTASFIIIGVCGAAIIHFFPTVLTSENSMVPYLISIAIITLVTFFSVWKKIYKVAHVNPAELVKKE